MGDLLGYTKAEMSGGQVGGLKIVWVIVGMGYHKYHKCSVRTPMWRYVYK